MGRLIKNLSTSQIILLGFAGFILFGCLLLMLPISTRDGSGASFADALFTSTSAVCVTGLVVHDTATYWSTFGQAVILLMIQIGGMGVVTIAVAIFAAAGSRISLKQRSTMQDAISAPHISGIVRMTRFILTMTVVFELAGAAIMAPSFCRTFGWKGLWYSLFHAVSAFCNAGFDLMGSKGAYSSVTYFSADPLVNLALMALIVIGGISFLTWEDVRTHGLRLKKYRMQSKVILTVSTVLILLPALYFFFFEFTQLPLGERTLNALFQSVTTRTAGFNTADLSALSEVGVALMVVLMLIGGSPGSTAGGMKTTTVAVLICTMVCTVRRSEQPHCFGRRIADETLRSAVTLLLMYVILFLLGGFIISRVEGLPLLPCLFETASAIGTVGLTLGLTPGLSMLSRGILILLMYLGRVGGLTMLFAASGRKRGKATQYPQEKLAIG